jgi:catechol 2,3-dioxygenase-like lactoylglutathione lyase family enzyme
MLEPMLKFIMIVTIMAPDLGSVEKAYRDYFHYKVVARGRITPALAKAWGAPDAAGQPYLLMQPESGQPVYLRFIQASPVEGYEPLRTYGWNCAELLVKDVDQLAKKLEDSPFRIIGPPRNLSSNDNIRAMQVIGPANEVLYLTRIIPGTSGFDLGSAKSDVDRVFIVVLGGKDIDSAAAFYDEKLDMPVTKPTGVRMSVLSKAHGLDPEQLHRLSIVQFQKNFLIEIDQYPTSTTERPARKNDLPPGLAMVSFIVRSLDSLALDFVSPPKVIKTAPYNGRRVAVAVGASGELIELVEDRRVRD